MYGFILAYFFLPAGLFDSESDATMMALEATYVVYESEIKPVFDARRNVILSNTTLSRMANVNPHIFCIDLALSMLELSTLTYFEPSDCKTESGCGLIDMTGTGYEFVTLLHGEEHETVCIIFRHVLNKRIVVSFR